MKQAESEGPDDRARAGDAVEDDLHTYLLERAIRIAVRQHEGQLRKGDQEPFITHPFAVALICARAGLSARTIAAALLHDVLEDTDMTRREMAAALGDGGDEVAKIVDEVTKAEGRLTWEEKSRLYLDRLRTAELEALAVAAADKIHNLYALVLAYELEGDLIRKRFNSTLEERVRSYEDVRDLVRSRWPDCPLLPELERQLERAREVLL
jgi:(p)ppGpp synthase/HD superfamily hydrolase